MAISAAALDAISKAVYGGGAIIVTAIFGAVGRKIYNPRPPAEVTSDRLGMVEKRVDTLEHRLNSMTGYRDRWRFLCLEARLMVDNFAVLAGVPPQQWPSDPEDLPPSVHADEQRTP